jgi:hypothetical protein
MEGIRVKSRGINVQPPIIRSVVLAGALALPAMPPLQAQPLRAQVMTAVEVFSS